MKVGKYQAGIPSSRTLSAISTLCQNSFSFTEKFQMKYSEKILHDQERVPYERYNEGMQKNIEAIREETRALRVNVFFFL